MKLMSRSILLLAVITLLFFGTSRLVAADTVTPTRTLVLFNGHDLTGWRQYTPEGTPPAGIWQVSDGIINCTGRANGYIRTENRYQDYRLTIEWRWVPGHAPLNAQGKPRNRNSGVLLHVQQHDAIWPKSLGHS